MELLGLLLIGLGVLIVLSLFIEVVKTVVKVGIIAIIIVIAFLLYKGGLTALTTAFK